MNPSDEEEVNKGSREINETEVAEERIVRHAEKNDSYRESPDLEEEIVQQPLEKVQKSFPSEEQFAELEQELISLPSSETVSDESEEKAPQPLMSQHDVEPVVLEENDEVTSEVVSEEETSESQVSQQLEQESSLAAQPEKVVYHTISGGPETLSDIASHQPKTEQPSQLPDYKNAPSGYSIPDPDYISSVPPVPPPAPPTVSTPGNFGAIFFFIFILTIGGAIGYVYFAMPDAFNQAYSAILVIKDQLLKK